MGSGAGREGSRPALSRSGLIGAAAAGGWPQSYEGQVREAYARNPVAQRAVRLVADGVAGAPLVASHPEIGALLAARSGGQTLLEAVAAQLLLHGNAFVQILRDPDGQVAELFALRPERVTVEPDASGWPAAFRYQVGAQVTRLPVDPARPHVVHLKSFSRRTTIMAPGAWARRQARSQSTMRRRCGTRRCWTMRRGRRARWCMSRVTALR